MKLYILFDIVGGFGSTSKLLKILRERRYNPRLITYDSIRLRLKFTPGRQSLEEISSTLRDLYDALITTSHLWKTICFEAWIEVSSVKTPRYGFVEKENVYMYIKPGRSRRVVYKLIPRRPSYISQSTHITESLTRKCLEDVGELSNDSRLLFEFIDVVNRGI